MTPNKIDIFPDVIRIESAGKCNFRCIHCTTGIDPNNREHLSKENFELILKQFEDNNFIPRVVVMYHGGEPLLNKNLPEFISKLKKIGVQKTVITTNGSLLTEDISTKLINAGLDEMKISFDGDSPEENNKIRKNGDFYKSANNLITLCKKKEELNSKTPNIIISNIRFTSKETLEKIVNENSLGDDVALPVYKNIPSYLKEYFKEYENELTFRSEPPMVWPGYKNQGDLGIVEFKDRYPTYCGALFETYSILSNGDVVLCCNDLAGDLVVGNIFETDMFEIWNNKKYTKLRDDFKNKIYEDVCLKCNIVSPKYLYKN